MSDAEDLPRDPFGPPTGPPSGPSSGPLGSNPGASSGGSTGASSGGSSGPPIGPSGGPPGPVPPPYPGGPPGPVPPPYPGPPPSGGYGYSVPSARPAWDVRPPRPAPPPSGRLPVRPSPVFLAMVGIVIAAGVYLWTTGDRISTPMRIGIFVFVAVGWTISLCVHEFAHAALAWKSGDRSVEAKGYLTLDPRRYMNRQLSIVLPIIIVLMGGIGLPGGAVMIDHRNISRWRRSLVSGAGPLTNAAFAVACAVPLRTHLIDSHHNAFGSALSFLALLEVAVTILNSLPIPGLDGFGVLAPFLPPETVRALLPLANYVFLGLFIVLLYSASASNAFYRTIYHVISHLGVDPYLADAGRTLFTFYRHLPPQGP